MNKNLFSKVIFIALAVSTSANAEVINVTCFSVGYEENPHFQMIIDTSAGTVNESHVQSMKASDTLITWKTSLKKTEGNFVLTHLLMRHSGEYRVEHRQGSDLSGVGTFVCERSKKKF